MEKQKDMDSVTHSELSILTEEEKISAVVSALREASRVKRCKLNEIEYTKRLKEKPAMIQITSVALFNQAISLAKSEIIDFALTKEEERIYKLTSMYFAKDPDFEKMGYSLKKGLLIYGNIGCGKTTMMKIFARIAPQSFMVVTCREIGHMFSKKGYDSIESFFSPIFTDLGKREIGVCFDDLGTESIAKNYGNEANVMAEIVQSRYENASGGMFNTHTTTNMNEQQILDCYGDRVASRIRGMFNTIDFPESSVDKRK